MIQCAMIRPVEDRDEWTMIFNDVDSPSFLQSWEWGTLNQEHNGYEVLRLGLYDSSERLVAIAQVLKIVAKRGSFLFVPHGPIFAEPEKRGEEYLTAFLEYLSEIARQERFAFIRMSPVFPESKTLNDVYDRIGMVTAPTYMHAERIWRLSLQPEPDQLLKEMRKTTRYLIRKADKEGIVIKRRSDAQCIDDFWNLYQETASRESFTPFSKEFVDAEYQTFAQHHDADYFFGEKDGKILAGALVVYTKSTAFYHQGASIHTPYPVPYALQWAAIQEARRRGCKWYNFWGILREKRTPKAWSGLTLFKRGFGGQLVDYILTKDFVINRPAYLLASLFERYLMWRRGV